MTEVNKPRHKKPLAQKFSHEQLTRILEQTLMFQCACPAQVCRTLIGLRELYEYQMNCFDNSDTDLQVHMAIAESTGIAHAEMERCLVSVLASEGWDLQTLEMPEWLVEKQKEQL